jgi:hypothetical protein
MSSRRTALPVATSLDITPERQGQPSSEVHLHPAGVLRVDCFEHAAVSGKLEVLNLPGAQLSRSTAAAHTLRHTPGGESDCELSFQLQGTSILESPQGPVTVAPGYWVLCDATSAYTWTSGTCCALASKRTAHLLNQYFFAPTTPIQA